MSIISLDYVQKSKIVVFIIYLTYLTIIQSFNSSGWEHIIFIQLKLNDTAVTLKYGQGHWKWYEQVKLKE